MPLGAFLSSVLFICDICHCAHRIPGWAEFLATRGWQVNVLTPSLSKRQKFLFNVNEDRSWAIQETTKFKSPYLRFAHVSGKVDSFYLRYQSWRHRSPISNLLPRSRSFLDAFEPLDTIFNDGYFSWISPAQELGQRIIQTQRPQVIVSSSSPFSSHIVASLLARDHRIPWVADYRDLWSLNHTEIKPSRQKMKVEKNILDSCSMCLVASEKQVKPLQSIFSGPIRVVNNAFTGPLCEPRQVFSSSPIRIVYTGSIYEKFMSLNLVFGALEIIINRSLLPEEAFSLEFYGSSARFVKSWAVEQFGHMPKYLKLGNVVSMSASQELQRQADLLLFLDWVDSSAGVESTKLTEYLRHSAPIVSTGSHPHSRAAQIIADTGRGFYFTTPSELVDFLVKLSTDKKVKNNQRNREALNEFSMAYQSYVVEGILQEVSSNFDGQT